MPVERFFARRIPHHFAASAPVPNRLRFALVFLIALSSFATPVFAQTPASDASTTPATPELVNSTDLLLAAVQPEMHDEIRETITDDLSLYTINAELLPPASDDDARINGTVHLDYVNDTGEPQSALPFRLYANGSDEGTDAVQVDTVTVDGVVVTAEFSVENSVLTVPLESPLDPAESVSIELTYTASVPVDSEAHYGIFGYDPDSGTWALAHWYPILAGWDPVTGWVLDPPSRNGDPIFSTTSLYDVTLHAPANWRLVTTGVAVDHEASGGEQTQRFLSGPSRDFTVVADNDFERSTTEVDGIEVISWFNPGEERVGEAVATYAAQSLELFNDLLGPYPFRELDLAAVELSGAAGVEFPQLLYMDAGYYTPHQSLDVPNGLDFTVAHEVVHQWWYYMVGNNQYDDAFIDEGLTNYLSSQVYFARQYGPDVASAVVSRYLIAPFTAAVNRGDDQIVDQPTDDFVEGNDYVMAAYSKAPLGFAAIHDEIGNEAFFAALQAYYQEFQFEIAHPADLLAAFEEASGQELDELWTHWFERREGEQDVPADG